MKNKCLIIIASATFFLLVFAFPSLADDSLPPSTLTAIIQEALKNNPRVKQAYQEWKASEYQIPQAGSLPDPMVSYGYFGESVETRVGPQEQKFGFSQAIPFPGKLHLKAEVQKKQARIMHYRWESARRQLIRDVQSIYYDIYWVDQALKITEEEKEIIKSIEQVARRKYETNLAPQQDVVKAQVEFARVENKLLELRQNRKSLEARMQKVLNRREPDPIPEILNPEYLKPKLELDELISAAGQSRQELQEAGLARDKAQDEQSLARMDYLPNFTLGVDYTQIGNGTTTQPNDGEDAWMGTIAVHVPIWFHKLNAQVQEKKARLKAAEENTQEMENTVQFEVQDIYFKITSYKDILNLYETSLVPQAQLAFHTAQKGYETGQADFLNWLDTERTLLNTRLAYYKVFVDYHKLLAELERVIGRDL